MPVGIDTISLMLTDYEIQDHSMFVLNPSPINLSSGENIAEYPLFQTKSGKIQMGSHAYINDELFNVDIKYKGNVGVKFFVRTSIPKFYSGGSNYSPVNDSDSVRVLKELENCLSIAGIKTNIMSSKISRVDLFSNIITEHPFSNYRPIFTGLSAKRKERREFGGEGFLWLNGQAQFCVYNKRQEMIARKMSVRGINRNSVRFEHRFLKSRKIHNHVGFNKTAELEAGGIQALKENYINEFKENIFKVDSDTLVYDYMTTTELRRSLKAFKSQDKRNSLQMWTKYLCFAGISRITLKDNLIEAVDLEYGDRKKSYRFRKELDQIVAFSDQLNSEHWVNLNELYKEIKSKVIFQDLN